MSLLDDLKAKGNAIIDASTAPIKKTIKTFSDNCSTLEQQYRAMFFVRKTLLDAGRVYKYDKAFADTLELINNERKARYILLEAMNKIGINPKDYGLSVYGLNRVDVLKAYPTLVFNERDTLGALPALLLPAAILVGVILITKELINRIAENKKINHVNELAQKYIADGVPAAIATKQATDDINNVIKSDLDFGDKISNAAKYAMFAALAWVGYVALKQRGG